MTFLALGNSAGDYFTNAQLSKMGFGVMALTACYAGNFFNLVIGFGATMVLGAINNKTDENILKFELFQQDQPGHFYTLGLIIGDVCIIS